MTPAVGPRRLGLRCHCAGGCEEPTGMIRRGARARSSAAGSRLRNPVGRRRMAESHHPRPDQRAARDDGRAHADRDRLRRRRPRRRASGPGQEVAEREAGRERRQRLAQANLKAAPGTEDQRLDSRRRDRQRGGDLLVGEAAHLPHQDRVPLLSRQLGKCVSKLARLVPLDRCGIRVGAALLGFGVHGQRISHPRPHTSERLVPGDRRQPRSLVTGRRPVQERALRRQERLLHRIVRLHAVAQQRAADRADERGMARVELLDASRGRVLATRLGSQLVGKAAHRIRTQGPGRPIRPLAAGATSLIGVARGCASFRGRCTHRQVWITTRTGRRVVFGPAHPNGCVRPHSTECICADAKSALPAIRVTGCT